MASEQPDHEPHRPFSWRGPVSTLSERFAVYQKSSRWSDSDPDSPIAQSPAKGTPSPSNESPSSACLSAVEACPCSCLRGECQHASHRSAPGTRSPDVASKHALYHTTSSTHLARGNCLPTGLARLYSALLLAKPKRPRCIDTHLAFEPLKTMISIM